jgi:hypothetical protein
MKWSWFDIAFELSTAANSRFCTTTNAKRSCQKVWSFHPNRWIQGEKRSVGGHHGRRWIWGWCDVNLDPTGPLDPWTLGPLILVNFKWKHHHFNKRNMNSLNTSIAWMPTGVYRSRGPSRYWGFFSASDWLGKWLHSGSRNMRDFSAPVKFFP